MTKLPVFVIEGVEYRVNRYGVAFGPVVPDVALAIPGWGIEQEVPREVRQQIQTLIQPARLRFDGRDDVYAVREVRKIAEAFNAAGA